MTAQDFIAKLAPVELERLSLIFHRLADGITEARLRTGMRLIDLTDVKAYLYELALAAKVRDSGQSTGVSNLAERRPVSKVTCRSLDGRNLDSSCPRCGHVHEGLAECGCDLGGGRICRCEMEVRA